MSSSGPAKSTLLDLDVPAIQGLDLNGPKMVAAELPKAQDMSHHLSSLAKHRAMNSLKSLYKYMNQPGMVRMAGGKSSPSSMWLLLTKGIPPPELFPFESVSAEILNVDVMPLDPPREPIKAKKSFLEWLFPSPTPQTSSTITIPKYVPNATPLSVQLATSLQYQAATGPPALPLFLREYVQRVYKPAYADWDVLLNVGNTDGWAKIVQLLVEPGDAVLVEEWTYPNGMNTFLPMQCETVPVELDGEGIIPEYLDNLLGGWNEKARGKKRPHVLYTIPTGQNPTGATMMAERKKAVYAVCKKYDVIICEDDPYFCLFMGDWTPKSHKAKKSIMAQRAIEAEKKEGSEGNEAFIKALPPSYLRFDTDGRVIRMDTFSKTQAPGSRMGWITSSPIFIERITRATEAGTQAPSGLISAFTTVLLQTWGMEGYLRWLRGIKATYRMRRTWMCDAFDDMFHLEFDEGAGTNPAVLDIGMGMGRGVTCYAKALEGSGEAKWDEKKGMSSKRGEALVSFIPPTAGMFIFLAVHFKSHPRFASLQEKGEDATLTLLNELWEELADNLVLFAPGTGFDAKGDHHIGGAGIGYFRLSYSIATYEETRRAVSTFAKVLNRFFKA